MTTSRHSPKVYTPLSRPLTSTVHTSGLHPSRRSSIAQEDGDHVKNQITPITSSAYSQRPSSSTASGRGVTRSNTYSSSSAQPFLAHPRPTIHQPNKLVKRSSSQNYTNSPNSKGSPHQRPRFRRPATSHQRSATWSVQVEEPAEKPLEQPLSTDAASQESTVDQPFVHFPRIVRIRRTIKGFSKQIAERDYSFDIRRIKPDGSKPYLLFAKSVVPAELEIEELDQGECESEWFGNSDSALSRHKVQASSSPLRPPTRDSPIDGESRRRQSFSIFRSSLNRKSSSASGPATKLKRKISQRISSAPSASATRMESPKDCLTGASPPAPAKNTHSGDSASEHSSSAPKSQQYQLSGNSNLRHVSMSSATSSSPEGSYRGHRVFSWGDADEGDSTSDTVYDSFRTGTTRSSYGTPRQPLETLFDKSTTSVHRTEPVTPAIFGSRYATSQRTYSTDDRTSFVSAQATPQPLSPKRSPQLGNLNREFFQDYDRSFADDEEEWSGLDDFVEYRRGADLFSVAPATPRLSATPHDTSRNPIPRDHGLRNSVFDWSEPPSTERGSDNGTPPRPKTVHEKKRQGGHLGNQSSNRRSQGGLHARSQSVPAFQDLTGHRPDVTHKFGTWDVGRKGATEDWDEDFVFEKPSQSSPILPTDYGSPLQNIDAIVIPDNIQKQQTNILANIGLLKEWGLLIEELKDLRTRAVSLGLRNEDQEKLFDEVDAMIDLADQEHEDDALSILRSPSSSSQHFSDDGVDGVTPPRTLPAGQARMSPSEMLRAVQHSNSVHSSPGIQFSESPIPSSQPRKDSEAAAQSVIQALQESRQEQREPDGVKTSTKRAKKMPFDTTTLKHIVPHVDSLMRRVKDLIRQTEGLQTSPHGDKGFNTSQWSSVPVGPSDSPLEQKGYRLRLQRTLGVEQGNSTCLDEDFDFTE